jgi:hypothetical protein
LATGRWRSAAPHPGRHRAGRPCPRASGRDFRRRLRSAAKRATDLADFGRTIRFLVATPSITGQMIALDGGQHIAWQTPDILDANE